MGKDLCKLKKISNKSKKEINKLKELKFKR